MEANGVWDDQEVKTLFKFVEIKKSEGVPLIKIFDMFAQFVGRHQNSVRNYYYKEIKELAKNKKRKENLGINLNNHNAKAPKPFSKNDTLCVVQNIKKLICDGYSVRGACLKLAGGDAALMVRYQNKYRSEVKYKQQKPEDKNVCESMQHMTNVIKMPIKQEELSDQDINALFLGLVKLVKRQEEKRAKDLMQKELNLSAQALQKAILNVANKQKQIENLQNQILLLNQKMQQICNQNILSNICAAKKLTSANSALKKFIEEKGQQNETNCAN